MNNLFNPLNWKWILLINLTLILILCLNSCGDSAVITSETDITIAPVDTEQPIDFLVIGDLSDNKRSSQNLTEEWAVETVSILAATNLPLSVSITHVSSNPPEFAEAYFEAIPPLSHNFSLDFPEKEKARQAKIDKNTAALTLFRNDFKTKIADFEFNKKTDFSYVNKHGLMLADFIRGDQSIKASKVVVLCTDFLDDPKRRSQSFISGKVIAEINDAISKTAGSVKFFVITSAPKTRTSIKKLKATFVSSFSQVTNSLKYHFPPAKN